jgi:hypothetical protein
MIDNSTPYNTINSHFQFEKKLKIYFKKAKKNTTSDKAKDFYIKQLDIIRNIGIQNSSEGLRYFQLKGSDIESAVVAPPVFKKMDAQVQQEFLSKILADVRHFILSEWKLDLQCFAKMTLESTCEFIIFLIFYEAFKTSTSCNDYHSQNTFFEYLHDLLAKKNWKKKPKQSEIKFAEFCKILIIPDNISKKLAQILPKIQFLGMQKESLPLTLENIGIKWEIPEEQTLSEIPTLPFLINLQNELFLIIQHIFNNSNVILDKFEKEIMINKNNPAIKKQLQKYSLLLSNLNKQIKIKISEGLRLCSNLLNPTSIDPHTLLLSLNELIKNRFFSKTKLAFKLLRERIEKDQASLELIQPNISRHAMAENHLSIMAAIDMLIAPYIFYLLINILENYKSQNKETLSISYTMNPLFSEFTLFMVNLCEIHKKNYANKKMEGEISKIIDKYSKNKPNWYRAFITHITKQFILKNFTTISETLICDLYQKFNLKSINSEENKNKFVDLFIRFFTYLTSQYTEQEKNLIPSSENKKKFFQTESPTAATFITCLAVSLGTSTLMSFKEIHNPSTLVNFLKDLEPKMAQNLKKSKFTPFVLSNSNANFELALSGLNPLQNAFEIAFKLFLPAFSALQTPFQDRKSSNAWLYNIDKPARRRRKEKPDKSSFTPPSKSSTETVPDKEKESVSTQKIETIPLKSFPHLLNQIYASSDDEVFSLDYTYHLDHAIWILDLITLSIQNKHTDFLPFLISKLINHLYHIQEQALTPIYLKYYEHVRHGLCNLSEALQLDCSNSLDQASMWFRYPHSSFEELYRNSRENVPEGLQLLLASDKDKLPQASTLTQNVASFLKSLNLSSSLSAIESLEEKANFLLKAEIEKETEFTQKENNPIHERWAKFCKRLEKKILDCKEKNPLFDFAILDDFHTHVQRLVAAIEMMANYPQQKFLSVHEHNIRFCGQYIIELALVALSQLEGDTIHTHSFSRVITELNLEISEEEWKLLRLLNVKKGLDYPFYETLKAKEKHLFSSHLQFLSEAYQISCSATQDGEGFLPAEYSHDIVEKKRGHLMQLAEDCFSFVKRLSEERIFSLMNE